jgi:hypothetical protein
VAGLLVLGITSPAFSFTAVSLDFTIGAGREDEFEDAATGDTFRYDNVITLDDGTVVDAILTVGSLVNMAETSDRNTDGLRRADDPDGGTGIDVGIYGKVSGEEGSASFTIDFIDDADDSAVAVNNVEIYVQDLDFDQFATFGNPDSFSVSADPASLLTVSRDGDDVTFTGPGSGSSDTDEDHWGAVRYNSLSTLSYTVGTPSDRTASFTFTFEATPWTVSPVITQTAVESSGRDSSEPRDPAPAGSPAIHLDVDSKSLPVLFEGEGLARNTPFSVRLNSGEVIASGEVGRFGYFSDRASWPADLAPGNYAVTLATTDPAGNPLQLTKSFTLGAGGVVTAVGQTAPLATGDVLAATGPPSGSLTWGFGAVAALTVLGIALTAAGYRSTFSARSPGYPRVPIR